MKRNNILQNYIDFKNVDKGDYVVIVKTTESLYDFMEDLCGNTTDNIKDYHSYQMNILLDEILALHITDLFIDKIGKNKPEIDVFNLKFEPDSLYPDIALSKLKDEKVGWAYSTIDNG